MGEEDKFSLLLFQDLFKKACFLFLEAKRTTRFLSGIINFIHFREACRETYMEFLWQYVRFRCILGVIYQINNIIYAPIICLEMVVMITNFLWPLESNLHIYMKFQV